MTDRKKPPRLPGGPLPKVKGFSAPMMEEILVRHPEVLTYLRRTAKALERHFTANGTVEISAPRRILVDRLLGQLAVARMMDAYLSKGGILRPDLAAQGVLVAHPLVASWTSLNNQINRSLEHLGLDELPAGGPTPLATILADYTVDDAQAADEDGDPGKGEAE